MEANFGPVDFICLLVSVALNQFHYFCIVFGCPYNSVHPDLRTVLLLVVAKAIKHGATIAHPVGHFNPVNNLFFLDQILFIIKRYLKYKIN